MRFRRIFAGIAALLVAGSNGLKLSDFAEPAKNATQSASNSTATAANSTQASAKDAKSEHAVDHADPTCESTKSFTARQYMSWIMDGHPDAKEFADHCNDLQFLSKEKALHWLDAKVDQCEKNSPLKKADLCDALKCATKDDIDQLSEAINKAAQKEADVCGHGGAVGNGTSGGKNLTDQAVADKNTLYSCMTDYAFFNKYEEVCQQAKLNAMTEGSYTINSCDKQASLLLKQKQDDHNLAQIQEDHELTIDDIALKICEMAKRCEEDSDYKCEMSKHFIFYLLP